MAELIDASPSLVCSSAACPESFRSEPLPLRCDPPIFRLSKVLPVCPDLCSCSLACCQSIPSVACNMGLGILSGSDRGSFSSSPFFFPSLVATSLAKLILAFRPCCGLKLPSLAVLEIVVSSPHSSPSASRSSPFSSLLERSSSEFLTFKSSFVMYRNNSCCAGEVPASISAPLGGCKLSDAKDEDILRWFGDLETWSFSN